MERKKKLIPLMVLILLIGGIPAALAAFVPGTGETVKINLMDAANPTASPVTYADGQAYIEVNDTYSVGDSFTVWLNITDVTESRLYGAGVTYDNSILECTSYEAGEFFYRAPAEYRTSVVNQPMLADGSGFLGYYNHVSWALKKPGNVSGTGTLASFDFTVVGWGFTKIDIILSGAQGAVLQDPLDNDIDFNTVDIIFDNTGMVEMHEISVSVEAPDSVNLGESSLLNATVENLGINNETDVNLQLLINGTEVNSTTITELLVNSSYTIDYLWTPDTEATYNITAYAEPVTGETVTENNVATKLVSVLPAYWCNTYPYVRGDVTFHVHICSNATVSDVNFSQLEIFPYNFTFNLNAPPSGTTGYYWCNVTIPRPMLDAPSDRWVVYVDVATIITTRIVSSNDTHTSVYFVAELTSEFIRVTTIEGTVIPEFPATMLLLLLMIGTIVVVTLKKIIQPKTKNIAS